MPDIPALPEGLNSQTADTRDGNPQVDREGPGPFAFAIGLEQQADISDIGAPCEPEAWRALRVSECPSSGLRKKGAAEPLPDGRGSVICRERASAFRSRARKQAVPGVFQQPAGALAEGERSSTEAELGSHETTPLLPAF